MEMLCISIIKETHGESDHEERKYVQTQDINFEDGNQWTLAFYKNVIKKINARQRCNKKKLNIDI